MSRALRLAVGLTLGLAVLKLVFAGSTYLLADEAYYWVWSRDLAWGYYDQPPVVAWMVRATTVLSDGELWVRLGAVLCGLSPLLLLRWAGDPGRHLLWWAGLPPLLWLTLFATSDAPLLLGWTAALAGALAGGPFWLAAGAGAALATLSKYTGLAVLPLAIVAAGPAVWRTRWPWLGLGVLGVLLVPHGAWLLAHDGVSVGFQLREGLLNPHPPGPWGVAEQVGEQALVLTPLVFVAVLWWAGSTGRRVLTDWGEDARVLRTAWLTSVPLLLFFALAALGGPPDAHWTAPALVGVGLGLSHARGRLARTTDVGLWLGVLASLVLAVHSQVPLVHLPEDPATRLTEGPEVARVAALWARAEQHPLQEPGPAEPVYTERYQEAAFIQYYTGIPARVFPGCGRRSQYDLMEPVPVPDELLFLRPATSGDALCTDATHPNKDGPHGARPRDRARRVVGYWQVFRVSR